MNTWYEDIREMYKGVGIRFTAPKTGVVKRIGVPLSFGLEPGWPPMVPLYSVGLQASTKYGLPDDVYIGYVDRGNVPDWIPEHLRWNMMNISSAALVEGEIYHIVMKILKQITPPHVGFVLSGDRMRPPVYWWPHSEFSQYMPYTQTVDLAYTGERWDAYHNSWVTFPSRCPFAIIFEDGTAYGNGYASTYPGIFGYRKETKETFAYAQDFEPLTAMEVSKLALWIKKRGNPKDNLYISLFDHKKKSYVFRDVIFAEPDARISTRFSKWYMKRSGNARLKLLNDRKYRLELKSPLGEWASNTWEISFFGNSRYTDEIRQTVYYLGGLESKDNGENWSTPHQGIIPSDIGFMFR